MTGSRLLWPLAVAASLGFHAALGLILVLAAAPDPLEEQQPGETRMEIVSYPVDRTEVASATPTTEAAAEAQAQGSAAGTAAIPVIRASAAPLPLAPAQGSTPPPATAIAEATPPAEPQPALEVSAIAAPAATPASARPAEVAPEQAPAAALAPAAQTARPLEASAPRQQVAAPEAARVTAAAAAPTVHRPIETAPAEAVAAAPAQADRLRVGMAEGARLTSGPPATDMVVATVAEAGSAAPAAPTQADRLRAGMAEGARLASGPPATDLVVAAAATGGSAAPATAPQPERASPTQMAALALAPADAALLTDASPAAPLTATPAPAAIDLPAERTSPAPPATDVLAGALPPGDAGPTIAPPAEAAAQRPAAELATGAPALAPPAAAVTAALAWSGETGSQVDPVSLAAIQSFMQEGDLSTSAASAGTVRDAITGLLASVPCARLQTTFVPETGHIELRGHIPDEALRAPVLAALHQQVGGSIPLSDNVLILPRPQCGALSSIEAVGLAQSTDQNVNPKVLGPNAHARVYRFTDGQDLVFELTGADYPAYVYIDYFDAEGEVIHLQPNETVPLRQVGIAEDLKIGAEGEAGVPWIRMTVSPPYGQEIVVAFVSTSPLYEGLRPLREPAGPYLDALRTAVAEARQRDPGFKGEWVYFFVSTAAS